MNLIDITKENWLKVLFLTTNENNMPTLCEEFVASNALSLVQAKFENGWITKAIEVNGELIGFTMYGYNEENNFYELCRIMIDKKFQGKGYGTFAIKMVLAEMKRMWDCKEVYLLTDSANIVGKHIYKKVGFVKTDRIIDNEELFVYRY